MNKRTGTTGKRRHKKKKLKSAGAKVMVALDEQSLKKARDKQAEKLIENYQNKAILAYQTVLPLLVEQQALTEFIETTGEPELRKALPEVLNQSEAVQLMTQEYNLSKEQQKQLRQLLAD